MRGGDPAPAPGAGQGHPWSGGGRASCGEAGALPRTGRGGGRRPFAARGARPAVGYRGVRGVPSRAGGVPPAPRQTLPPRRPMPTHGRTRVPSRHSPGRCPHWGGAGARRLAGTAPLPRGPANPGHGCSTADLPHARHPCPMHSISAPGTGSLQSPSPGRDTGDRGDGIAWKGALTPRGCAWVAVAWGVREAASVLLQTRTVQSPGTPGSGPPRRTRRVGERAESDPRG